MLRNLTNILQIATNNIKTKIRNNPIFIATEHFQERLIQRFQDEDFLKLEKAIEKAFEKAESGKKIRYTHPAYNVTIVGKKMGLNGFELITCWQREEDEE
ncbi:hypothetical protein ACOTVS_12075 [Aliarcobacter butzleri]